MAFQVGDRVRYVGGTDGTLDRQRVGLEGVVVELKPVRGGLPPVCRAIRHRPSDGPAYEGNLVMVTPAAPPMDDTIRVGDRVRITGDYNQSGTTHDGIRDRGDIGEVTEVNNRTSGDSYASIRWPGDLNWAVYLRNLTKVGTERSPITDLASVPIKTEVYYLGAEAGFTDGVRGPRFWRGADMGHGAYAILLWGDEDRSGPDGHCNGGSWQTLTATEWHEWTTVPPEGTPTPRPDATLESCRAYLIRLAENTGWCRAGTNRHFARMGLDPWEDECSVTITVRVGGTTEVSAADLTIATRRGTGTVRAVIGQ